MQETVKADARAVAGIGEGIESCIGKTPLFRIKSLSEATGCEILGKAEVCAGFDYVYLELPWLVVLQCFMPGGGTIIYLLRWL